MIVCLGADAKKTQLPAKQSRTGKIISSPCVMSYTDRIAKKIKVVRSTQIVIFLK